MVEEVDLGELLCVVDADVAIGLEGLVDEPLHHLDLLRRAAALLGAHRRRKLLLGDAEVLAEHVLDHERDVGRVLEEALPLARLALADVRREQRGHRVLAQLHPLALHRRDRLHAVGGDLREHCERDLGEGLGVGDRALVERLEDAQHERLLVGVALELVEHLDGPLGDLLVLAAAFGGEAQEQREEALVEMDVVAVLVLGVRLGERRVRLVDARARAERHDLVVPEKGRAHDLVGVLEKVGKVGVEIGGEENLVESMADGRAEDKPALEERGREGGEGAELRGVGGEEVDERLQQRLVLAEVLGGELLRRVTVVLLVVDQSVTPRVHKGLQ